jgi:DNA topoisomerase-1
VSLSRGEDPFAVDMARCQQLIEEKELEDAPIATYQGLPVTKGKGRFGPFIKWKDLFVNVPVRYKLETLTAGQAIELLEAKLDKEANRIIQQWPDLKIAIENGRWGPFIKFGKENLYLPKVEGERMTKEQAALLTLEEVKAIIEKTVPDAFAEKPKAAAKNKATEKAAADKATSTKRATSRKK